MKIIESRTNQEIKQVASLHEKKYRYQYQQFIAEGIRTISTLIAAGYVPEKLYITHEHSRSAAQLHPQYTCVSQHVMQKISTATTPSGILAVFALPQSPCAEQLTTGLVLADITDPGNMGTLIRSCVAMGFKSVIVVKGTDPWGPKVIQSSVGTIGYAHIFFFTFKQLCIHKKEMKLCALVPKNGIAIQSASLTHCLFVVGNEAEGIPDAWLKNCNEYITIKMLGKSESLNAAVAGSIALYVATIAKSTK